MDLVGRPLGAHGAPAARRGARVGKTANMVDSACLRRAKHSSAELSSPGAPPMCPSVEAAFGGGRGALLAVDESDCTERYSTLLVCGGALLMLRRAEARRGPTIHHDYWWSVLRPALSGGRLGAPTVALPSRLNMSHNAAFACDADGRRIIAYGGRRKQLRFRDLDLNERGIHRVVGELRGAAAPLEGIAPTAALRVEWGAPRLVLDGSPASGCVERRSRVGPNCEFDGKLSTALLRGRTLVFARANVAECGGRHVQVREE